MEGRFFNDKYDELRFRQHLINHDYDKILLLWGEEALVQLQKWYEACGYKEGIAEIAEALDSSNSGRKTMLDCAQQTEPGTC